MLCVPCYVFNVRQIERQVIEMAKLLATTVEGLQKVHAHNDERTIGNNTLSYRGMDLNLLTLQMEDVYTIVLHNSDIVKLQDGDIYINLAGWDTVTTRERINQFLPAGWGLYRDKKITYLGRRDGGQWEMPHVGWVKVQEPTTEGM